MNICIIPAKGHSERIPDKNVKPFCRKPVIEYTLDAVRDSACFDVIVVSTDSDKIGNIASRFGAVYHKRPPDLALDDTPMVSAVLEVLPKYPDATTVCMAYACSPFIKASTIQGAYIQHNAYEASVTTAVYHSAEHEEYSMLIEDDVLISRHPEYKDTNSNNFPPTYQNAGQFYIADIMHLERSRTLTPANMIGVVVDHGIDIDTPEDWERAEALYILRNHPKLLQWSMDNPAIIAECESMDGYGSVTINYAAGEITTVDRSTSVRTKE